MISRIRNIPNEILISELSGLIAEGREVIFKPKGFSMLPFIRGGKDDVIMKKVHDLKPMDIVLAEVNQGVYVLHRIIRIEGDRIVLMGDGNVRGVESCRREDVVAVATRIIRGGREIDCSSVNYMLGAKIWQILLPFRRYLLAIYKLIIKQEK